MSETHTIMEKINIAELLKDCPNGMELDCTMYDNVTLGYVLEGNAFPIKVQTPEGTISLTKDGCYSLNKHAKCVIFPKGKTTWKDFQIPFKDGDIAVDTFGGIHIMQNSTTSYCYFDRLGILDKSKTTCVRVERLATEEEKEKLFQAIKDNGYKWNEEAKTLEKLPRFKAGDRIKKKGVDDIYAIEIKAVGQTIYTIKDGGFHYINSVDKDYELVPNKFDISTLKPFESKVLVRDYDIQIWIPTFWGRYLGDDTNYCNYLTSNGCYKYCIPYEGNEHLLGTKNDCDEFYKIWK